MKILTKYAKNGYDYVVVKREGDLAIAKGQSRTSISINWEVIEIQSHDGLQMGKNWVNAKEYPPRSEQWGVKGWTACSEEQADEIFAKRSIKLEAQ